MSIVAISDTSFAVSFGNEDVKVWNQMKQQKEGQEERLVWQVVSALRFRDLKVKMLVPNVNLRLSNVSSSRSAKKSTGSSLAILHENGWVSFWAQDGWSFSYSFRLNAPAKSIIFESSSRYLASLTEKGQVEVWRLKGKDAQY